MVTITNFEQPISEIILSQHLTVTVTTNQSLSQVINGPPPATCSSPTSSTTIPGRLRQISTSRLLPGLRGGGIFQVRRTPAGLGLAQVVEEVEVEVVEVEVRWR